MRRAAWMLVPIVLAVTPCPAPACILCFNIKQTPTFRQEAGDESTRLIVFGTLSNPRLKGDMGGGVTDLNVQRVLKADPKLPKVQQAPSRIVLPYYLPVTDAKNPPSYVLFCNAFDDRFDPFRGVAVKSAKAADYLAAVVRMDRRNVTQSLQFFFRHLDDPDPEVANDAFMEFAKANDQEIGLLAGRLDAAKLRRWLADPQTPPARCGLYAFLLGSCGEAQDLAWFQARLASPDERWLSSLDGVLSGYIQLRPKKGWETVARLLGDRRQSLGVRLTVVRTVQFYQACKPKETREPVLHALRAALTQGELADLAIEELRRYAMWEPTAEVLAQYNRTGLDAPVYRRAVVRYALTCPEPAAKQFIEQLRKTDPNLVREQEYGLKAVDK